MANTTDDESDEPEIRVTAPIEGYPTVPPNPVFPLADRGDPTTPPDPILPTDPMGIQLHLYIADVLDIPSLDNPELANPEIVNPSLAPLGVHLPETELLG